MLQFETIWFVCNKHYYFIVHYVYMAITTSDIKWFFWLGEPIHPSFWIWSGNRELRNTTLSQARALVVRMFYSGSATTNVTEYL